MSRGKYVGGIEVECPRCGETVRIGMPGETDQVSDLEYATVRELRELVGKRKQCGGCDSMVWVTSEVGIAASPPVRRQARSPTGAAAYFYDPRAPA